MTLELDTMRLNALSPSILHLILMPTERCNFRCVYCYEDFKIGRMKPDIVQGVSALLRRRLPGLTGLHIAWFGGEPTLAPDIIATVNGLVLNEKPVALDFTSSMSTNGWLLEPALLQRFLELGVSSFQVSLDGDRPAHDATRRRRDGSGSFDRIWGNLERAAALDRDFLFKLRLHVHAGNLDAVDALITRLTARFGGDPRFMAYAKAIEGLPGAAGTGGMRLLQAGRIVADLNARLKAHGLSGATMGSTGCYASRANSLVVRADGRIAKCTVAFDDDRNDVGRLTPSGDVECDQPKFRQWIRGVLSGDVGAMICPLHGLPATAAGGSRAGRPAAELAAPVDPALMVS